MRAGAAAVLIALGTSFLAMVGLAPGAAAHHANISGSTDCGGVVSWTATSWSNTDGAGDNAEVQVDYQLDGAGGFQPVPTGSPGAFDVPASPSFSGTFTVAGSPDTVTLRVTAVDDWGNGAAGGQTQSQTYDFPKGCNPPPQPPPPGPTPDPSATAAVECAYGSIKVSFTGKDAATTADIFRGGVLVRDDVAVPVGASSIDIPLQPGDEDSTVTVTVDFAEGADPAAFLLPVDCQHPDPAAKATLVCGTGIDVVLTNSGAQATTADIRKDGALVGDDVPVPPGSSTFTVTLDAADEDTDVTIIVDFAAGNDLRSTIAVDCVPVVPPPPPPPPPPVDECPDLPGTQTDPDDCPPPVDECPDLPGTQTDPDDCPPPVDVCTDLPGTQTDPADCPLPVDECPLMDGLQTDPTLCDTVVGGIVVTPTPTPAPGPTQVLGTQVTRSQPLPTTGADTRGLAAAGVALILAGAAIAATGYRKDTVPET